MLCRVYQFIKNLIIFEQIKYSIMKKLLMVFMSAALFVACAEGEKKEVKEEVQETTEEVTEGAEEAMEDATEAVEEAAETVGEAMEEAGEALEEAAETVEDAAAELAPAEDAEMEETK